MSSFISTYFEYDNISSDEMGVQLVHDDVGLISSLFGYSRSPITEKIKGKGKEYFFGLDQSPFKFSITLALIDDKLWTKETRLKIAQWLFQSQYKPFISGDNLDVIYYCMVDGESTRFDNATEHGYVTINFICNSPYPFSPTYVDTYDYSTAISDIVTLENLSNVNKYFYPEIEITMVNDTAITIMNLTNGNEQFTFTGLNIGEKIYVNNQSKQIISSLPNTYRLGKFNKRWLKLVNGINRLKIIGNVQIVFKSSFPIIL